MAHPYAHKGLSHPHSRERVKKMFGHFADGGGVTPKKSKLGPAYEGASSKVDKEAHIDVHGGKSKSRGDKYARGGKVKHGGKGHHTKINIVVAPSGGGDKPPLPAGPMGASPPPPMPPKGPMGPPPSPMAGGMPGAGGPPLPGGLPGGKPPPMPGMKEGGGVKPKSGIANPDNLKKWADYASTNTRYASGGSVLTPETGGALTGEARLAKAKKYGLKGK